ncbi:MAG: alpha/beta hydrolase [Desulfobacterales bacterium]|nr:alpha/beta hydrolase [Desulfobacterales bacterium]
MALEKHHEVFSSITKRANSIWKVDFRIICAVLMTICLLFVGCSTRVGTRNVGYDEANRQISTNSLNSRAISTLSLKVLSRYNLASDYQADPKGALAKLELISRTDRRRDLLFVLAELSYDAAGKPARDRTVGFFNESRKYYLNAAVFAYFYLFEKNLYERPNHWDRTFRWACNIYNTALAKAFQTEDGQLVIKEGAKKLPSGKVTLTFDPGTFPWDLIPKNGLIIPSDELDVYGLSHRNRESGIGVPFLAVLPQKRDQAIKRSYPGILLMRIEDGIAAFHKGALKAKLELYTPLSDSSVQLNGVNVPLEKDLSVHLAHTLNQRHLWDVGLKEFFTGKNRYETGLYEVWPHRKGSIPVVFVHGTFSNPLAWAEMCNTLVADPMIRNRYHFYFYLYDSNRPVNLSALFFRGALSDKVQELDPEGTDPYLKQMVVIGHSQGGLLTKMTVTNTGDDVISALTGKGLNELELSEEQRLLVERTAVFNALPFVKRTIFISTPHRGSQLVTGWITNIVRKVVSLSADTLNFTSDIMDAIPSEGIPERWRYQNNFTSIDSMAPDNPALLAFSNIPLAPGVNGHSIIGIQGDGDPTQGSDGVVTYKSAHLEGMDSELIIQPCGHSSQWHPLAIEEVRRILRLHINEMKQQDS